MNSEKSVIVNRQQKGENEEVKEIKELTKSAGYTVADTITQYREEDPVFNVGSGKILDVFNVVDQIGANAVIFNNELTPRQKYNIGLYMPDGTKILDRYTLVLEIFDERADTKRAQLQVELARLRYELPRVSMKLHLSKKNEHPGFMGLGDYDENKEQDIKDQISRIRKKLDKMEDNIEKREQRRKKNGYQTVSLAGFTNAGKTTLMKRLSKNLEVQEETPHVDIEPDAEVKNNLFTTLDTKVREADIEKRNLLISDTVGFIEETPYWLINSFKPTLQSIYNSDVILIVVDASQSKEQIEKEIIKCHDILHKRADGNLVTVLNKSDKCEQSHILEVKEYIQHIAPYAVDVSAKTGKNIESLKDSISRETPDYKEAIVHLDLDDEAMSYISRLYEIAHVKETEYVGDSVTVKYEAPEHIVSKMNGKIP